MRVSLWGPLLGNDEIVDKIVSPVSVLFRESKGGLIGGAGGAIGDEEEGGAGGGLEAMC